MNYYLAVVLLGLIYGGLISAAVLLFVGFGSLTLWTVVAERRELPNYSGEKVTFKVGLLRIIKNAPLVLLVHPAP
jgi:hypothetical protein